MAKAYGDPPDEATPWLGRLVVEQPLFHLVGERALAECASKDVQIGGEAHHEVIEQLLPIVS